MEEKLREQTIKVIEQDAIIRRLEQENDMIERKFEQSLNSSLMDSYTTKRHAVSFMVSEKKFSEDPIYQRIHCLSCHSVLSLIDGHYE